jgi:maleylpyruvate isomerase
MKPDADVHYCTVAHRALVVALAPLTDDDFRSPSLLPGYSRGHVVTHLANKARAHVWVFGGPSAGEIRQLHPDGYDADRAAADGARRSADELRADLRQSFDLLETTWHGLDDVLWESRGIMTAGPRTMTEIVRHHMRNVEVHHVDLDIGYRPVDWPANFVEGELPKRLRSLLDRADHAELLAWLLGRSSAPELQGPW